MFETSKEDCEAWAGVCNDGTVETAVLRGATSLPIVCWCWWVGVGVGVGVGVALALMLNVGLVDTNSY